MDPKLQAFINILANTAQVLSNPGLGIGDVGKVTALLGYATTLMRDIAITVDQMNQVDAQVATLVSEGRPPSPAEWASWQDRLSSVDARFTRVQQELDGPTSEPGPTA